MHMHCILYSFLVQRLFFLTGIKKQILTFHIFDFTLRNSSQDLSLTYIQNYDYFFDQERKLQLTLHLHAQYGAIWTWTPFGSIFRLDLDHLQYLMQLLS
jgi:hypothetical protein